MARDNFKETDLHAHFSKQKGSTLAIAAVNATEWLQDDSIPVQRHERGRVYISPPIGGQTRYLKFIASCF